MNEISEYKKFIFVILIFVILIQMQGCVSTKIVNSVTDIPDSEDNTYILHTTTTKYQILNARISDGIISGNLINGKHAQKTNKVHFYLKADSVLKFNSDMTMALPFDKISKIEIEKPAKGATAILISSLFIAIIFFVAVFPLSYQGM